MVGAFLCGTVQGLAVCFALFLPRFELPAGRFGISSFQSLCVRQHLTLRGRLVVRELVPSVACFEFLPSVGPPSVLVLRCLPYLVLLDSQWVDQWLLVLADGSGIGSGW